MAFSVANNVQETTQTGGTGTLTLLGAVSGALAFSSQLSNSDTTLYVITDGIDIEIGIGTFTSPDQLSRDTVRYSTNGNSKVNWSSSGTRNVYCALDGGVLSSLLDPSSTGLMSKIAAAEFAARTLTGDSTIDVTNGDGVTGNPTVGVADNAVDLAQMAGQTRGDLVTYDASGNPTTLAVGAANRVLGTVNGTDLSFFQIVTAMLADLCTTTAKLAANAVTNPKLAQVATATIKGRTAAATGEVQDLTVAQVLAMLQTTGVVATARATVTNNGTAALSEEVGVASVNRSATGTVDVTLDDTMSSSDYTVIAGLVDNEGHVAVMSKTTTGFEVRTRTTGTGSPLGDFDFDFIVMGTKA